MGEILTPENADKILKPIDREIVIFSIGYLMGKTGKIWHVTNSRSYLDFSLNCTCLGDGISFSTRPMCHIDQDSISERLDEVIESYNREALDD